MGGVRGDGDLSPNALLFSSHDHMSNQSEHWIRRMNEGIAQLTFFDANEAYEISYTVCNGQYQGQTGVTLPQI
jgi:deoxycytidine triphosphate deaminase